MWLSRSVLVRLVSPVEMLATEIPALFEAAELREEKMVDFRSVHRVRDPPSAHA